MSEKKEEKKKKKLVVPWPLPAMDERTEKQEAVIQQFLDKMIRPYTEESKPETAGDDKEGEQREEEKEEEEKTGEKTEEVKEEKKDEVSSSDDEKEETPEGEEPLPKWPKGPPPPEVLALNTEDQYVLAYKYCMARKFKLKDAIKMARTTWLWKQKYKFYTDKKYFPTPFPNRGWDDDELNKHFGFEPRTPEPIIEGAYRTIIQTHQVIYHKWDNQGHPVLIERTGNIQPKAFVKGIRALAKIGQPIHEPIVDYHVYFNEVGARLIEYQDQTMGKTLGRRVLGFTAVMDCDGLGFGHLHSPALDIMKKVWACDSAHYPEGLHKCLVVNSPGSMEFLFRVVKGWLDHRIQEKVLFLTPDKTPQALLETIDPENLPEYLGGTCTCEGGCVIKGLSDEAAAAEDEVKTEEINIKAGTNETREFVLDAGEEITWEFEVVDKNIEFSVEFVPDNTPISSQPASVTNSSLASKPSESPIPASESPAGGSPAEQRSAANRSASAADDTEVSPSNNSFVVAEKTKSKGEANNYVAKQSGKLVMVWDNSYSWLKSKTLRMRLIKV